MTSIPESGATPMFVTFSPEHTGTDEQGTLYPSAVFHENPETGTVEVFYNLATLNGVLLESLLPQVLVARMSGDQDALAEARGAVSIIKTIKAAREGMVEDANAARSASEGLDGVFDNITPEDFAG